MQRASSACFYFSVFITFFLHVSAVVALFVKNTFLCDNGLINGFFGVRIAQRKKSEKKVKIKFANAKKAFDIIILLC